MLGRSMLLSTVRRVEAPDDYWAQVLASAIGDERLTFDQYRLVEHPYVEQWWQRHWDMAEPLMDGLANDHVRAYVFDAEDLAYRYVVTAFEDASGTIVLIEFRLF